MEQRPLRLGDIVDDYCPRERRLTNHAIVAVVDNNIRQTRCTTCDAEHVYKGGREPRRRGKTAAESAYEQVLADVTGGQLVAKGTESAADAVPDVPVAASAPVAVPAPAAPAAGVPDAAPVAAAPADVDAPQSEADAKADAWLAHRRLIRAALPRTEGEAPPARPIPEFTMHQRPQTRGARHFRFPFANGERNGNVLLPHERRQHQHGERNGNNGGSNGHHGHHGNGSDANGAGPQQGRPGGGGGGRRRGRRRRR